MLRSPVELASVNWSLANVDQCSLVRHNTIFSTNEKRRPEGRRRVDARAVSGCRSAGVTRRSERPQRVWKPSRWQQQQYRASSRRAMPVSASWGHPGRKSPSDQSSTCACLSPLPPAVSMVISSANNHKIFVNGNTPGVVMRHRFRHICQRLRPRSHSTIKSGEPKAAP